MSTTILSLDIANGAAAVTPANFVPAFFNAGLYIGSAGAVAVVMADGTQVTFAAVPAGTILPIAVREVLATGTTASGIVGLNAKPGMV